MSSFSKLSFWAFAAILESSSLVSFSCWIGRPTAVSCENEVVKGVNHLESCYVLEDSHRFTPFLDPTIHKTHQRFGNSESQVEHCHGGAPSFLAQASFYSSLVMQRSRTVEIIWNNFIFGTCHLFNICFGCSEVQTVVQIQQRFGCCSSFTIFLENSAATLERKWASDKSKDFQNPHNHL